MNDKRYYEEHHQSGLRLNDLDRRIEGFCTMKMYDELVKLTSGYAVYEDLEELRNKVLPIVKE